MNLTSLKSFALGLLIISVANVACKKSKSTPNEDTVVESNNKQTKTTDRTQLTNDSLFLYAKQIYYWKDALPAYDTFEPRNYGGNYDKELFAITQYKINPETGKPYEFVTLNPSYPDETKYSYIQDITQNNPQTTASIRDLKNAVDLEGFGNDIGIRPVSYISELTDPYLLYVTAVYPNSPADLAGVKRGWNITKINNRTVGSNYSTDQSWVSSALSGSSVKLEGTKYESGVSAGTFSVTLKSANYSSSPVYASKVLTAGTKKIGYLAYGRFSRESNSKPDLDAAFAKFSSQGVTDLVIDLRYNGGGYVSTAEYLTNLIAPSTATGTMFIEYYNTMMQTGKADILKNQPRTDDKDVIVGTYDDYDYSPAGNTASFEKKGTLTGVKNVVFLVSDNTASASELVINSLKPHMTVKLVGETTYGKPVGFFPVRIENRYDVYLASFETKNSAGQGGYYTGMTPDFNEYDDPRYDFGDKTEIFLARALSILAPGTTISAKKSDVMSVGSRTINTSELNIQKPANGSAGFNGMIDDRRKIKK